MAFAKLILVVTVCLGVVWCDPDAAVKNASVGIIGGHRIRIEQVPYMASLRLNGTYHWCGGSIIHERFILTSAHCIIPNREFKILVGTDQISGDGELYDIEAILIHKKYDKKTQDFDFCLIKLKNPLTLGPKVAKINLPVPKMKLSPGTRMNVTGWGSTGPNASVSPYLQQVEVPLISRLECGAQYFRRSLITKHMICAGNLGHDSCQGDSGGPLTLGDVQIGVTSFGLQCGKEPGVYAKVSAGLHWIQKQMQKP